MRELTTKTIADDSRIGSHSAVSPVIAASSGMSGSENGGNLGRGSGPRKPSPRVLQPLGDPADRREQRLEEIVVRPAVRAPARQQLHLKEAHRVHVRIAQPDRALQRWVLIEQRGRPLEPQEPRDGTLELRSDDGEEGSLERA